MLLLKLAQAEISVLLIIFFIAPGLVDSWRAGTRRFVLFLPFHPSVLKPNFYLTFSQTKGVCNLDTPPSCKVTVEVKLLLQL